jgi:chromosome segregation protein
MQLKRLEISGFKSFRDKVVFDFSSGVSAIVGPNGCGKSNVVDALRWVMGEQRVKALRGKKMDDIIFHGSQDAAPIGVAEVVMVLTCAKGHTFPGLYANCTEVTVSRRLFRDGDSEYAINQIPCRLLDVKEFFLGTGVGARTYSLVEQNSVAGLVEAKPEERRQFIEEAAGVSKYRSRKEAAVRKMEATKQNLLRLNDVLREVKSQLNTLARQAKRAEQYRNLKAAIREGEVTLALYAYLGLHAQKTSLEEQKQSLEDRIADEERLLQSFEAAAEAVRAELLEQEAFRSRLQEELYSVKNRIHLKEQAIEFSRNKAADLQNRQARHQVQMEEDRSRLDAIRKEQGRLACAASALEEEIGGARTAISDAERNSEALRGEERTSQQRLETQKARLIDLAAEKARLRNSAANLARGLEDLRRRIEKEERERNESDKRLEALSGQAVVLQRSLENDEEVLENLANRSMTAEDEQERIRTELGETEERIADLKESLSAKASRLQSLREFQERYGWCSDATKAHMTAPSDQCQSGGSSSASWPTAFPSAPHTRRPWRPSWVKSFSISSSRATKTVSRPSITLNPAPWVAAASFLWRCGRGNPRKAPGIISAPPSP